MSNNMIQDVLNNRELCEQFKKIDPTVFKDIGVKLPNNVTSTQILNTLLAKNRTPAKRDPAKDKNKKSKRRQKLNK